MRWLDRILSWASRILPVVPPVQGRAQVTTIRCWCPQTLTGRRRASGGGYLTDPTCPIHGDVPHPLVVSIMKDGVT